jgi:alpha-glucosidase
MHAPLEAPATWVLSNHDVTRPVTRFGRADTSFAFESRREGTPTDRARGTRRARAAALLAMALPGSMYIYQGEELGLPEVEDIPPERRQDPMWFRSGGTDPGRDGCRIPLPWAGDRPPYGFSVDGVDQSWLDQPDDWAELTVEAQSRLTTSMLALYREGLRLRRMRRLGVGELRWIPSPDSVVAFARGEDFTCVVNFGPDPVVLPPGNSVLLASSELEGGALPHDSTVWLCRTNPQAPSGDRLPRPDTASDRSNGPAPGTNPVLRKE